MILSGQPTDNPNLEAAAFSAGRTILLGHSQAPQKALYHAQGAAPKSRQAIRRATGRDRNTFQHHLPN